VNSQDKAKEYLNLMLEAQRKTIELAELNRKVFSLGQELYDCMEDEDIPFVGIEVDGEEIKVEPKVMQSFKLKGKLDGGKWDCEEVFKWLRDNGYGDIIKQRESVPWNTREATLKGHVESGEQLPSFMEETNTPSIKIKKKAIERIAKARYEDENKDSQ
jgi:hypothetical protein